MVSEEHCAVLIQAGEKQQAPELLIQVSGVTPQHNTNQHNTRHVLLLNTVYSPGPHREPCLTRSKRKSRQMTQTDVICRTLRQVPPFRMFDTANGSGSFTKKKKKKIKSVNNKTNSATKHFLFIIMWHVQYSRVTGGGAGEGCLFKNEQKLF